MCNFINIILFSIIWSFSWWFGTEYAGLDTGVYAILTSWSFGVAGIVAGRFEWADKNKD